MKLKSEVTVPGYRTLETTEVISAIVTDGSQTYFADIYLEFNNTYYEVTDASVADAYGTQIFLSASELFQLTKLFKSAIAEYTKAKNQSANLLVKFERFLKDGTHE